MLPGPARERSKMSVEETESQALDHTCDAMAAMSLFRLSVYVVKASGRYGGVMAVVAATDEQDAVKVAGNIGDAIWHSVELLPAMCDGEPRVLAHFEAGELSNMRVYSYGLVIPMDKVTYQILCDPKTLVTHQDPEVLFPEYIYLHAAEITVKLAKWAAYSSQPWYILLWNRLRGINPPTL